MNKVGAHTTVHMDMQRSQPPPTSAVMTTSTTETSINPSTPTSVFQHVIVQPLQIPKTQAVREENAKNNGILCKFFLCHFFKFYFYIYAIFYKLFKALYFLWKLKRYYFLVYFITLQSFSQ